MRKFRTLVAFVCAVLFVGFLYLIFGGASQVWQIAFVADRQSAEFIIKEKLAVNQENAPEVAGNPATSGAFSFDPVKILLVGDIMLDRYIRQVSERKGEDYIFSCIGELLADHDFVVGNLEGPITDNDSVSAGSVIGSPDNYTFTFPPTSAEVLARHNIRVVNLGNNHIGNFGREGILSTMRYLEKAGVNHFGGLYGDEPVHSVSGISFVSYNEFGGQSPEAISFVIAGEKAKGNTVIVYAHWGEEYADFASEKMRETAELFVRSGAGVIVGSHPHVVFPSEYIEGVSVYYSLGNFIFDQYWNSRVMSGLVLSVNILDGRIVVEEHPVMLNKDGRTCAE